MIGIPKKQDLNFKILLFFALDILRDKRISEHESFIRKSLIRVPRALESISCYDATKHSEVGNAPVSVNGTIAW